MLNIVEASIDFNKMADALQDFQDHYQQRKAAYPALKARAKALEKHGIKVQFGQEWEDTYGGK